MEQLWFNLLLLMPLLSLTLFFIFRKHRSIPSSPKLPPGSIGYPVVGESLAFLSTGWKGHPEKFILDRISRYSSLVFKTNLFGEPMAVFCGASANKFLFSNENKLVVTWWPKSINKIFPSTSEASLKEDALRLRKMLPQFLKPEALQRYVGVMDAIMQRHFSMRWENKERVVVYPLAMQFTFLLACKLFMSIEDPDHVDRLMEPFRVIGKGIVSIPIDIPGTTFHRAIKASKLIRKDLREIIRRRKTDLAEGRASATQDILSCMLSVTDEVGKHLNEMEIANNILALLIGGHDTTSATCSFVVKFLAEYPEIYEEVYAEQKEIVKSKGRGELLNWEDIQRMRYSWKVVCEVLRLAPPLQGTFRETLCDFTYDGFDIPKGWKIHWSTSSTHRSAEYFPEPEKFDPSRFQGNGPLPYSYVPFGGGPRMCPGKEYARLEILVFMHNLAKRFRWEKLIPDEKVVVDSIPIPANGLPIRLYPHVIQTT